MSQTPEIDVHEAAQRIAAGALLIDVREQNEFDAQRIPDSKLMPLSSFDVDFSNLPKDQDIVVQCRSGARSARAADFLNQQAYTAVNLAGGILAWEEAELPHEP